MDLVLLVLPSLFFVLLQYKSNTHAEEVKSIQESLEDALREKQFDKARPEDGHELRANRDAVRTVTPKRIDERLILAYGIYLLLVALVYCINLVGVSITEIFLSIFYWKRHFELLPVVAAPIFSIAVFALACMSLGQMWKISRQKKMLVKAKRKAEGAVAAKQRANLIMPYLHSQHAGKRRK